MSRTPEFHIVNISGIPYRVPVLGKELQVPHGAGVTNGTAADLHRTSAAVVAELEEGCFVDAVKDVMSSLSSTIRVPSALIGVLIGHKGSKKQKLEAETGATLSIPRGRGVMDEVEVTISASSTNALESMQTRVALLVEDARVRCRPTHFLSLPLTSSSMQARVSTFVSEVTKAHADAIIGLAEMLVPAVRFHLTLGTLKILTAAQLAATKEVVAETLPELQRAVAGCGPLSICGLEYMNDDPSAVDVLYAKVTEDAAYAALQAIWLLLHDRLQAAGVLLQDEQKMDLSGALKAHATVMNSRWRRSVAGQRTAIDVRLLLGTHGSYYFGAAEFGPLHLSRLTGGVAANGYYQSDAVFTLVPATADNTQLKAYARSGTDLKRI
eukprot:CAMPEP_0119324508 /NCGR_PEP_ID=MMETSP1333-20130426/63449_1 /TAXON_ID=418940 /ORGANISM="Scyphosphaera apsteinii, Strain RCC1455" /LENGTH=381 /DNA_ID=CAMNT_0007332223 /DNA_START=172 /DNA_END=1318 /DNA_ORIENTATION=-